MLVLLDYRLASTGAPYFGCATTRRYGRTVFQPSGYFFAASSLDTLGTMITSFPGCQFTGVATWCLAVSCMESITRSTSSKLRPVVIGYTSISLIFLSGPMTNTVRTVALLAAVRPAQVSPASAGCIP